MDTFIRLLNPLLMILMPLGLGVFLARRLRVEWRLYGIGALTFIGSQILHIPFNLWILQPFLERQGLIGNPDSYAIAIVALLFGLSAGLFEESARALIYATALRGSRSWRKGLMFGAGHGGVEALLLGLLALYGFFQALALQDVDLRAVVPLEQLELAQAQLQSYWSAPWHMILLGAVERVGAMAAHIFMATLVLQSFLRRNPLWIGAAIFWHTALNAVTLIVLNAHGPYWAEAVVIAFGLVSVGLTLKLRTPDPETSPHPTSAPSPAPIEFPTVAPSPEQLEDSRYV
jgi:uncharacterized membrane protein YhfC